MEQNKLTAELFKYGITDVAEVLHNPSYEVLFEETTRPSLNGYERAVLTESGAVSVDTGEFTGRSPKDKYIVRDAMTHDTVWWSDQGKNDNKPITDEALYSVSLPAYLWHYGTKNQTQA